MTRLSRLACLALLSFMPLQVAAQMDSVRRLRGVADPVTLEVSGEPIAAVLNAVVKDAGLKLKVHNLDPDRRVSVRFEGTPRGQVLFTLSQELDLFYEAPSAKMLIATQWSHLSGRPEIVPVDLQVPAPERIAVGQAYYPELARVARFEAHVLFRMTIDERGTASVGGLLHCDLNHASHGPSRTRSTDELCGQFLEAAANTVAEWRFEPPVRDGGPVAGEYEVHMAFRLQ